MIAGVNFKNAILFESQGVDWLQREMHDSAGRVSPLNLLLCRGEGRVHAAVVYEQSSSIGVCDQFRRAALDILFGHVGSFT